MLYTLTHKNLVNLFKTKKKREPDSFDCWFYSNLNLKISNYYLHQVARGCIRGLTINIAIVIWTCNHINTPTRVIGGQHYTTLTDLLTRLNQRNQNFSGHLWNESLLIVRFCTYYTEGIFGICLKYCIAKRFVNMLYFHGVIILFVQTFSILYIHYFYLAMYEIPG